MPKTTTPARIPSYRLHKARDCAVVEIDGRNHYLGPYGSAESKEKYARLIAELAARNSAAILDADELQIVELAVAYLDHARAYYCGGGPDNGHVARIKRALKALNELYGSTKVAQFGPLKFQAVRKRLIDGGLARSEINATANELRRAFKWGVSQELVPPPVLQGLQAVQGLRRGHTDARESEPVRPVDDSTVEATLPHLPAVVRDMVQFQRLTGCRPGEVCALCPGHVDTSGEIWIYSPPKHKTAHHGHQRRIMIGPRAQVVLRPYLLRAADARCFTPADSERKRQRAKRERRVSKVQPSQRDRRKRNPRKTPGDAFAQHSFNAAVRRACAGRAGLARPKKPKGRAKLDAYKAALVAFNAELAKVVWTPNQLRHSAATEIRRQFGLEAAQVVLGHSNANVTQVYAERDHSLAASVMKAIG